MRVGPVKFFADGGVEPTIDAHVGEHHFQIGRRFEGLDTGVETAVDHGYGVAIPPWGTPDSHQHSTPGRRPPGVAIQRTACASST